MSDRIRELENLAEECERAADDVDTPVARAALLDVADYFRSRARILSKVRGEKE